MRARAPRDGGAANIAILILRMIRLERICDFRGEIWSDSVPRRPLRQSLFGAGLLIASLGILAGTRLLGPRIL